MTTTGVRLTARRRLAQFLITKPPEVEIDGAAAGQATWGGGEPTFLETTPGHHRITVKFQYMGKQRVGEASIDIDVTPGQEVPLLYRSPWVLTSKGSLRPG
jgi:hypothetical protein